MFIYKEWENFCKEIDKSKVFTAKELLNSHSNIDEFIILKHDVETNVRKAFKLAQIENKYNLKGSFYVQAYLLNDIKNIEILKKMKNMGHEISYHYDVLDSEKGNYKKAKIEFDKNLKNFKKNGFDIKTVCQHGNPLIERKGYNSNRDFFRSKDIKIYYEDIFDIVVDFKKKINKNYKYISDAGYGWKIIYDPENNDVENSEDKNIKLNSIYEMLNFSNKGESIIISTHPHRWQSNGINIKFKTVTFGIIKSIAKKIYKIKIFKNLINKYYFLAKKF